MGSDFGDDLTARVQRLAVYAQDEWEWSKQFSFYLGARWEGIETRSDALQNRPAVANRSAVFAPLAFTPGRTGRLFGEFALTLAGAVIVSGFCALTLTPMMCSKLLKHNPMPNRFDRGMERALVGLSDSANLVGFFENDKWSVRVAYNWRDGFLGVATSPRKAAALREAGLKRVTVSLDALDDGIFRRMNDVDFPVADVLDGISAAQAAGFGPIKVNMVVKRGTNDHEIVPMARHFKGSGIVLLHDVQDQTAAALPDHTEFIERHVRADAPPSPVATPA